MRLKLEFYKELGIMLARSELGAVDFVSKFYEDEEKELWKQNELKELRIALERVIGPNSLIEFP